MDLDPNVLLNETTYKYIFLYIEAIAPSNYLSDVTMGEQRDVFENILYIIVDTWLLRGF